jgi:hypothetical protein
VGAGVLDMAEQQGKGGVLDVRRRLTWQSGRVGVVSSM